MKRTFSSFGVALWIAFTAPMAAAVPNRVDLIQLPPPGGTTLSAVAINDYKINIPMTDVTKYKVIVARLLDDKPMPVREKGPLFVVYPFDSAAELRTSTYYERSIWQLKALDIQ